ncbi:MAG: PilN family type IVB pilus formation outer membrane protein [Betaproteobacteria bacterium]|nr:PilN family type IVB pilus formation outer membrane protein [Betaproteobacteria bacterium]
MKTKKPHTPNVLGAVALCAMLASCSTAYVAPIRHSVHRTLGEARGNVAQAAAANSPQSAVTVGNDVFLAVSAKTVHDVAASWPRELKKTYAIKRHFGSLFEAAAYMTKLTDIPTYIAPDVMSGITGSTSGLGTPGIGMPAGMPPPPPIPVVGGQAPQVTQQSAAAYSPYSEMLYGTPYGPSRIVYVGPASGALDAIAGQYGISWKYGHGRIDFYRYETKTFTVAAIPGDSSLDSTVSDAGQSANTSGSSGTSSPSSSGDSNQTTVSAKSLSVWDGLEKSIKAMLSKGGRVVVSPSVGTVTVTDIPMVVDRVADYVKDQNIALSRQAEIRVQVYQVTLNHEDQYGINWGIVYKSLAKNFGWAFTNVNSVVTNPAAAGLTLNILPTAGQATGADIGAWAGSQAIFQALSTQGDVAVQTSTDSLTLNNQVVPVINGEDRVYVANEETTPSTTAGVAPTTTAQQNTLSTGFSMTLLPHILNNRLLMMQFALKNADLVAMNSLTTNGMVLQQPDVTKKKGLNRFEVASGQTIVLSGLEQNTQSATTQGVGSASNVMAGGGLDGQKARTVLVIVIQAIIIPSPQV